MPFPREDEGQHSFLYGGEGESGEVMVTMGFTVTDHLLYSQTTNDDISAEWAENVVANTLCSQMNYLGLRTIVGDGADGILFETNVVTAGGLTGNTMLPVNNAVVVKKLTGLAGRRNRGRIYLPGIPEDAVDDDGIVLSTFVTTINTALADWKSESQGHSSVSGAGWVPAILHKAINIPAKDAYVLADAPATSITSFVTDTKIGSQRARLRD